MPSSTGKEALVRATIAVVARDGLPALTNRSVAAEAGVSHGLVRHHFGTREVMLAEALEFAVTESLGKSNMIAPLTDASTFGRGINDLAARDATLQAFQYELLLASRNRRDFQPLVQRYYRVYRDAAAARLSDLGVTDQSVIDLVWFCLDGLVFKSLIDPDPVEGNRVLARIRQLIIDEANAEREG